MKVVVSVSDKYIWCLKPFSYFFNKYWSELQDVVVAGYGVPQFELPKNFKFYQIDSYNYPKEKWVDGFLRFLRWIEDDTFALLLEDYWLCRTVDVTGVSTLNDFMLFNRNILRMDLTADRQYAGGMKDIGYFGHYDIIEAKDSQYQMSLQAGIWNRKLLIDVLDILPVDCRSAWDVELTGTTIVNENKDIHVFGTRQVPVRYVNAYNNADGINKEMGGFMEEDKNFIQRMLPRWIQQKS
jgi:hypothetical protein